ncbi:MAG: hypothetical protein ACREIA_26690, partial [Opitutaceae bacterium]
VHSGWNNSQSRQTSVFTGAPRGSRAVFLNGLFSALSGASCKKKSFLWFTLVAAPLPCETSAIAAT